MIEKFQNRQKDNDNEVLNQIQDPNIKDGHDKECILCSLKTSFIFSNGLCEFCRQ